MVGKDKTKEFLYFRKFFARPSLENFSIQLGSLGYVAICFALIIGINISHYATLIAGMSDDIKEILNHLIATPKESQIQVDFDLDKRVFFLSVPIYSAEAEVPRSVKEYVEARKGKCFKPHATSFEIEGRKSVKLIQKIPFNWGFDSGSRQEIGQFLQLAKRCHRMLYEIALEEIYKEALHLDSDLGS